MGWSEQMALIFRAIDAIQTGNSDPSKAKTLSEFYRDHRIELVKTLGDDPKLQAFLSEHWHILAFLATAARKDLIPPKET